MNLARAATLAIVLAMVCPATGTAWGAEIVETVAYYDVSGTRAGQLKRAMRRHGPREGGRRFLAYTQWILNWTYTFDELESGCHLESFDVHATIKTTLPRWDPEGDVSEALLERWNGFVDALERHEAGHARVAGDAARSLESAIFDLGPRTTCAVLEREIETTARSIVDRYRGREQEYDERTNHGRAQGGRF